MVQARVTDDQYDYLAARAYDVYDGDLSAALRAAITWAEHFEAILASPDPGKAVEDLKEEWAHEYFERRSEMRMDQPEDEGDVED